METEGQKIIIAHVIHNICLAGTELNVIKQVNALDRNFFKPVIISLSDRQGTAEELIASDVSIFKIHKKPGLRVEIISNLVATLKKIRPHIIYSHNWTTFFYSIIAAKCAGVPVILHGEHGRDHVTYQSNWKRTITCRYLSRWCHRITVVSKDIIEILENIWKVPGWKIEYMPNGVDVKRFSPIDDLKAPRKKLHISPSKLIIGAVVGKLRPVKDIPTLLRAFQLVVNRLNNVELLLVGDGVKAPELIDLIHQLEINNHVRLMKYRSDMENIFRAIDIFVNSSLYEGMSNTILEAQACGVPIVATAVGGTPTIIRNGWNGILIPPRDPQRMAEAILSLAEDEQFRKRIRANGRTYVENYHNYDNVIKRFELFYQELYTEKERTRLSFGNKTIRAIGQITRGFERFPHIKIKKKNPIFIFNYHRIIPDTLAKHYLFSPMVTSESVFEKQIQFFKKKCNVIQMDEALELIANPNLDRFDRTVVITFDDGYRDFYLHAFPILQTYDIPASLFVVVNKLNNDEGLWFDQLAEILCNKKASFLNGDKTIPQEFQAEIKRVTTASSVYERRQAVRQFIKELTYLPIEKTQAILAFLGEKIPIMQKEPEPKYSAFLNWEELLEISESQIVAIGSHGLRHQRLDSLSKDELEREVLESKIKLEESLGKSVDLFSYPWGAYNQNVVQAVRKYGYRAALILGNRPCYQPKSLFEIERIDSNLLKANGNYDANYMYGALTEIGYSLRRIKSYFV